MRPDDLTLTFKISNRKYGKDLGNHKPLPVGEGLEYLDHLLETKYNSSISEFFGEPVARKRTLRRVSQGRVRGITQVRRR
jgi:hypothetical protein